MRPGRYLPVIVLLLLAGLLHAGCASPGAQTEVPPTAPASTSSPTIRPTDLPRPTATPTISPVPPSRTPRPQPSPTPTVPALVSEPVNLRYIDMINSSMGWAFAPSESGLDRVLATINGGQTWRDITPPEAPPEEPDQTKTALGYFRNSSTAWITYQLNPNFLVPEELTVWRTTDGGLSWIASSALDIPADSEFTVLSDLAFADSRNGWVIAHVGVGMNHDYFSLFATQDGGDFWRRVVDPFSTPDIQGCIKTGLQFANASLGWLTMDCQGVLAGAFLYQTTDGGFTWETVQLPPPDDDAALFNRAFCSTQAPRLIGPEAGSIYLKCVPSSDFNAEENFLYRTDDAGMSWEIVSVPRGELQMLDDDVGWALSADIYQTLNGGASWQLLGTVAWEGQFSFVSRLTGWAIATDGEETALVRTGDGGANWQILEPEVLQ